MALQELKKNKRENGSADIQNKKTGIKGLGKSKKNKSRRPLYFKNFSFRSKRNGD